jgi:GNAT superfamily N-acetyltransferase
MAVDYALLKRLRIEALDRKRHDRASFSCGDDRVDNFLKSIAAQHQDKDLTRAYVACLDGSSTIVGYYALNPHALDISELPPEMQRRLPRCPTVPAILLSYIGVGSPYQGSGVGSYLMADAFKRSAHAADLLGAHFMVLDALNEGAARLYRRLGFVELSAQRSRMILSMHLIRRAVLTARTPGRPESRPRVQDDRLRPRATRRGSRRPAGATG